MFWKYVAYSWLRAVLHVLLRLSRCVIFPPKKLRGCENDLEMPTYVPFWFTVKYQYALCNIIMSFPE